MVMLVVRPERYTLSTFNGIKIWAVTVLPSLFPFFFLTALLTRFCQLDKLSCRLSPATRFLYKSRGVFGFVQIMSFLSGYPVGVKMLADLSKKGVISSAQATKGATFCSTSGPLFIVGSVGYAMFGDKRCGFILLLSHYLSAILCGVAFRFLKNEESPACRSLESGREKDENVLYESVYSSVISVAVVGGFIAVFYTLSQILTDLNVFAPLTALLTPVIGKGNAEGVCLSLIECTFACKSFSSANTALSLPLAAGAISLGGLSVWCQSAIYLKAAGADFRVFSAAKLLQAFISVAICSLLTLL